MRYLHLDVFTPRPVAGNGLTVVFTDTQCDQALLQNITIEFRQFETIFIAPQQEGVHPVRIFTMQEELPFAGHPLLGAAAAIHHEYHSAEPRATITLLAAARAIELESERAGRGYKVRMNQGTPHFGTELDHASAAETARALSLEPDDLDPRYCPAVVSTGLPYLLVPLRRGLDQARISRKDFEQFLSRFGARFVYVFDTARLECRTWDNSGTVEDIATGSAAGPLCAWLVRQGLAPAGENIHLHQGRLLGRESVITGRVTISDAGTEVFVEGEVSLFATGNICGL